MSVNVLTNLLNQLRRKEIKFLAIFSQLKGVKKVCSALHDRISNHLKRKLMWKIAFLLGLLFLVMLYIFWHHV